MKKLEIAVVLTIALATASFAGCSSEDTPASGSTSSSGGSSSGGSSGTPDGGGGTLEECEVAVIGGGAGGLHTAFRLGPSLGKKVCLFEKETYLGGRLRDVAFDGTINGAAGPNIGTGGRRVMEGQEVLFALATELGIELEAPPNQADLIEARDAFAFSKDDLAVAKYPTIPAAVDPEKDRETEIYDKLRSSTERAKLPSPEYPDFVTYIKKVAGEEQFQFLHDMSRFRADFEYPLDARGYLDYLDEEWDVCCQPSYPKGGMSAFIRGMETKATQAGVRIYKGEGVTTIAKKDGGYEIATPTKKAAAKKVVIAVPPAGLDKIGGDVADRIKATSQYQQIIGVKVVTVTQWWDDAWWKAIGKPGGTTAEDKVWRAWTTKHCLNFIEIPIDPYADAQKVTRSAYVDGETCANYWENLAKQGDAAVAAALSTQLTALFNNGVSDPATVTIPNAKKTVVQVWPGGWYWLKAGATITNAQLSDWATEPLAGEPVGLVGEAYNVQRSGWSDGAYKSSIKLLNTKYGQTLPGLKTQSVDPFAGGKAMSRKHTPRTAACWGR